MIASIAEEFQLTSSGFANKVKTALNLAFGSSTSDQTRDRELFYLRGLNQYNQWLHINKERPLKIMEFVSRIIKKVIKFPKYELDVLKHQNLVFENNEFSLVDKHSQREGITYQLRRIYDFLGIKDSFNKWKNNLKLAFYAFRDTVGDDIDMEFFYDYLKDKEIKNIPFKHYGNEDKMVFSLELNEFSWVKLSEVPPQKAKQSNSTPFQCDANLCVDYLKDLNLKETEENTYVDDTLIKHLHVYLKNKIVHYSEAKDTQAWYVEDIVDHFYDKSKKKWFYTVKWKQYSDAEPFVDTDEPLSNMTNCEALILAYHRIKRSFSRYKLKQVQERINKVKQRNKRKLKLKTLMPDEPPILDSELPRFTEDEALIQNSKGLKDTLLKTPCSKKQRLSE